LLVGNDLKFHYGVMGRAVNLRSFQKTDIVCPAFVAHKVINVPAWRRRFPRQILRGDDDIEPVARIEEQPLSLETRGGFLKGGMLDAKRGGGLL